MPQQRSSNRTTRKAPPGAGTRRPAQQAKPGAVGRPPSILRSPYAVEPIDLRALEEDPWPGLAPAPGWEGIADTCRRVAAELPAIADHVVRCIETEIPSYAGHPIPPADLSLSVLRNLEALLLDIAERREPGRDEIEIRRELGRRRAMQGLAIEALIQAFHVGYRELWNRLIEEASQVPGASSELLQAATTAWNWINQATHAVLEGYQEIVRSREMYAVGARQRFVELLLAGEQASDEAIEAARSLGFDPGGSFRAAYARAPGVHDASYFQPDLAGLTGHLLFTPRGDALLIISQGFDVEELESAISKLTPGAGVGIGLERSGLDGVRESIGDAERALEIATRQGRTSRFEDDWLEASLLPWEERLRELLQPAAEVARRSPHLAEAVRAFARCSFSVSDVAGLLSVHPNTILYRLNRWELLTGWNPRSFDGLARSLAGIALAGADRASGRPPVPGS